MRPRTRTAPMVALAVLCGVLTPSAGASNSTERWFTSWSRPQSVVVAAAADPADGGRGPSPLVDQSVRNIVRLTGSGSAIRLRLSNRYGATLTPTGTLPLRVKAATVGRRTTGASATSLRKVTFKGRADVTIAPGATVVSDPVAYPVTAGHLLAVSVHVDLTPMAPSHGASFVTSYVSPLLSGDHTRDTSGAAYTEKTLTTPIVSGVDVRSPRLRGTIATTGGSVVDGHGSEPDAFTDWPSWLSKRLTGRTVVNNGLGGTTAAAACAVPGSGPSVEERVAHDSLGLSGVTHLLVYAGTNDIAGVCTAGQIIAAYRSIISQARARGVRVLISTITPRGAYTALQNAERDKVNAWVRAGGRCSGQCHRSLDFDAVVRDPANHQQLDPRIDSGDGIHPNGEGYRRLAASIPLDALR
jgi:lysophospholipase L1-like esterase